MLRLRPERPGPCGGAAGGWDKVNVVAVDVPGYETDADSRWIRTYQVNQLSTAFVLNGGLAVAAWAGTG